MINEHRASNVKNEDSGDGNSGCFKRCYKNKNSLMKTFIESDSDFINEQLTGNIHKIAIVPPNYNGRPKKGHLIFDACFECGK